MDVHSQEQRRRNMQAIKSHGTKDEVALGKALWKAGLRYRKNDRTIYGKPDFTLKKFRVAIFVDSEFFHGKNWSKEKLRIGTNRQFWWDKIESNIRRDKTVNKTLRSEGWTVLRFWSKSVRKNPEKCVEKVFQNINTRNENLFKN